MQSRYYNAEVGRFINGDEIEIIYKLNGDFEALDIFSYCFCDPINDIDLTGRWRAPKLVAFGIQLEGNFSVLTFGIEIVFANGNIYLFDYNGASGSKSTKKAIEWIKLNLLTCFSKKAFKTSLKKLVSASISLCVFGVFSSSASKFSANKYKGPFVGTASTFPTIYGVAVKSYFSTYSTYTCIGIGFSYPSAFDISFAYTRYYYRGKINLSSKIRNFVNKNTKGLKP